MRSRVALAFFKTQRDKAGHVIAQAYDFGVVAAVISGPTLALGALWLPGFAVARGIAAERCPVPAGLMQHLAQLPSFSEVLWLIWF